MCLKYWKKEALNENEEKNGDDDDDDDEDEDDDNDEDDDDDNNVVVDCQYNFSESADPFKKCHRGDTQKINKLANKVPNSDAAGAPKRSACCACVYVRACVFVCVCVCVCVFV
jgi:hypothetical protein